MSATPGDSSTQPSVLELKVDNFSLLTLQLFDPDMDAVAAQLANKVNQAPDFFQNAPVVIDLNRLASSQARVDFPLLVGIMRGYRMVPVGVRGGNAAQHEMAEMMDLAILSNSRRQIPAPEEDAHTVSSTDSAMPRTSNRLIARPVRSGQRFYAQGGDLIVAGSVNSGAEVLADGNIHVYGFLRGRAHAGVKGDVKARIFCQSLQPELVSIAGRYRVNVSLDPDLNGKPVTVYLKENSLFIHKI